MKLFQECHDNLWFRCYLCKPIFFSNIANDKLTLDKHKNIQIVSKGPKKEKSQLKIGLSPFCRYM